MSSRNLGLKARIAIVVVAVGVLPGLIDTVFMVIGLDLEFTQRIQVNMLNVALAAVGAAILVYWLRQSFSGALKALDKNTNRVAAGAESMAVNATELAEEAHRESSALEATTKSLKEMHSATEQNAKNSHLANTLSRKAKDAADVGHDEMSNLSDAMTSVQSSAKEVSSVIKAIEEIAFQTNLLALNAAVEAARAGEHGRGFAVVADEVRNLAQRAAKATKESTRLISDNVTQAEHGSSIASEVGKSLDEIMEHTTKVADLMEEISSASAEQAHGIGMANEAVEQIKEVNKAATDSATHAAEASTELTSRAQTLRRAIDGVAITIGARKRKGGKQTPPSPPGRGLPSASTRTIDGPTERKSLPVSP